jgi:hypothetical protein
MAGGLNMKTTKRTKLKAPNKVARTEAAADAKTALAARTFYRGWMDRIRLTDVAQELGDLQKEFQGRAELMAVLGNWVSGPTGVLLDQQERRARDLAQKFGHLREKIGWVLQA